MKYQRLSRFKIKRIILCFAEDIIASSASKILHINRNTINAYYNEIREKILQHSLKEQEKELGEFELDESYFGARRVRGKKGRGAAGKTPVFGLLKRKGKVFVTIVPNCSKEELCLLFKGKSWKDPTIHTDGWKAYDGLILMATTTIAFSIARTNLLAENRTSTASSASGIMPNGASLNSMV